MHACCVVYCFSQSNPLILGISRVIIDSLGSFLIESLFPRLVRLGDLLCYHCANYLINLTNVSRIPYSRRISDIFCHIEQGLWLEEAALCQTSFKMLLNYFQDCSYFVISLIQIRRNTKIVQGQYIDHLPSSVRHWMNSSSVRQMYGSILKYTEDILNKW